MTNTSNRFEKLVRALAPAIRSAIDAKITAAKQWTKAYVEQTLVANNVEMERKFLAYIDARTNKSLEGAPRDATGRRDVYGPYHDGEKYLPGQVCHYKGHLWLCDGATFLPPGTVDAWTLLDVDGKDRRR